MKINNLLLENYRNIESLKLDFESVNIIWGENAQGKTNLIEAIYLFTGAKSFRGHCRRCNRGVQPKGSL